MISFPMNIDQQMDCVLSLSGEIDRLTAALLWVKENLSGLHSSKEIEDTIDGVLRGEPHNDTYVAYSHTALNELKSGVSL